jgi:2-polyprenyl-3-methyl-5-hydroxy-6-metoxy-1,4-benzoquinol methylase
MVNFENEDITFVYIERPLIQPSSEEALLRELSTKTFCSDGSMKTIVTENPAGVTVGAILEHVDTPLAAVSLDDTLYYSRNWLAPLREGLKKGYELLSPSSAETVDLEMPYFSPLTFNDVAEGMMEKYSGQYVREYPMPPLAFLLERRSLGRLDPKTSLFELPAKLKTAVALSSLVHSFGDYFSFKREDLLPFVPHGIERVLDVGCAKGLLGEAIKRGRGCMVFGVEMNKEAARMAKTRLDDVFCLNIEDAQLPFDGNLDVIIFADILEHLFNPWHVLENSRKWLRPGGIVVGSIPNVAHYSVILDLLRGRWDYIPYGLLCVSHIRFFTKTSIESMFTESGYSIITLQPQEFSPHLRERVMKRLEDFIKPEGISEEILYPGYYIVARKE